MALSTLTIAGIIIIVIGIIMAIIGIILLIVENAGTISWYVWLLVIGGILMAIIGGVILAVALSEESTYSPCSPPKPKCPLPPAQSPCNMGYHHHNNTPVPQPIVPQQTCPLMTPSPSTVTPITSTLSTSPLPRPNVPIPIYSQKVVQLGNETFNPDPVTSVVETPGQSVRRTVSGPYGENGEETQVTGTHKIPGQRKYITKNIPEHDVISDISNF